MKSTVVAVILLALIAGTGAYIALMVDGATADPTEARPITTAVLAALSCLVAAAATVTVIRLRPARPTADAAYEQGFQDNRTEG